MMPNIVKLILAIVIVAAIALLQCAINLSKRNRKKQFALVVLSLIFGLASAIYVLIEKDAIISMLIPEEDTFVDILVLNVIIATAFLLVKLVYCGIGALLNRKPKEVKDDFRGAFYEYDVDFSEWFLLEKWTNVRRLFKAFMYVCVFMFGIYFAITWCVGPTSSVWMYLFPIIVQIVITEIYNYLNGYTKQEFGHVIYGDDAIAEKISNFYRIREIYEKVFPKELLSANTAADYMSNSSTVNEVKKLVNIDDKIERITAEFFEHRDKEQKYDIDGIQATMQMMKGNNVVFFNPFYRDLGKYLILPITDALLSDKNVLVLIGRKSTKEDVKSWISSTIKEYNRIRSLWRVKDLDDTAPDCEVGILEFSQLYDFDTLEANQEFLDSVGLVIMLEPSLLVNTGQVGLRIVADQFQKNDKPVYCVIDRPTDGLIDTISHLLHTEFTNVMAPPVPKCIYTGMSWNADGDYKRQELFDKETKFLGNGIELAAVAIKNQIPKVTWYGEKKAPIKDIKWIAGQHFNVISKYMNVPSYQHSIYEKIDFVSNMWFAPSEREQFIIAEDEFCNMFSTIRAYMCRGEKQTFVNVLSENYMLRDYMRCNAQLFLSNPSAIPSIVPDYANTERNVLVRLLFKMAISPMREDEIKAQLILIDSYNGEVLDSLMVLLKKYTTVDDKIFTIRQIEDVTKGSNLSIENTYEITKSAFNENFATSLKTAFYVIEDEASGKNHIDAKLYGHVTQSTLPGQFLTYDGKYYKVKDVSPDGGVILRRASDLYDGRKYYKQIRKYRLSEADIDIVKVYNVMDIEVAQICRNIEVETTGYLEMNSNHDLRTARTIDFTKDEKLSNKYNRSYRNKDVLRIKLPETNDKIRFTICMLLSEAFKTIFPDSWQYLAVTTSRPDDIEGMLNYTVYSIEGDYNEEYIYVIEDSDMDLGLLGSVEKNMMRFMEIIADFLNWHFEKMKEPASKDPVVGSVTLPENQKIRRRMLDRIRKLFGGKEEVRIEIPKVEAAEEKKAETEKEKELSEPEKAYDLVDNEEPEKDGIVEQQDDLDESDYTFSDSDKDEPIENEESKTSEEEVVNIASDEGSIEVGIEEIDRANIGENPDFVAIDGTDIFDNAGIPEQDDYLEESFRDLGIMPIEKSRYQKECFLKFGFEEIDSRLHIEALRKYLTVRGWSNNALYEARTRDVLSKTELDFTTVADCDFCGKPLSGVSYERLNDGRIRCNECSMSAINSEEEFVELFQNIISTMESFFGIDFKVGVAAKMTDAKTIARGAGSTFVPSSGMDARVLGFAQKKKGRYSLFVENGSPRLAAIDTVVHEMTHIWQYLNWDDKAINSLYDKGTNRLIVYEGMAMWAAIQYLYMIGETNYAYQQELLAERRNDVYGVGFILYRDKYPLIKDSSLIKNSPFTTFPPL